MKIISYILTGSFRILDLKGQKSPDPDPHHCTDWMKPRSVFRGSAFFKPLDPDIPFKLVGKAKQIELLQARDKKNRVIRHIDIHFLQVYTFH